MLQNFSPSETNLLHKLVQISLFLPTFYLYLIEARRLWYFIRSSIAWHLLVDFTSLTLHHKTNTGK